MEKVAKAAPMLTKKKDMDLERKSVAELKELLDKQKKLLHDKNLIKSLPDHGKKIAMFIEKIKKSLDLRNNSVDDAADKLKRMQLGYTSDERIDYANSYEFVINQNSDVKMKRHPKKFVPNRLTKDKKDNSSRPELSNVNGSSVDVQQKTTASTNVERKSCDSTDVTTTSSLTNKNSQPQTIIQMDEGNETERRLKNKYDASLEETFLYDRKHAHGAQLISIQEGMNLLKHHHTALQEAEMKRAETMLAASCSTKLSTDLSSWRGERFNRYRDEHVTSHGEENDDDDDSDKDNEIIDTKSSSDDDDDGVD